MLGLDETSQTTLNLQRTGELVLNLPDAGMANAVDRLAKLTGVRDVPLHKQQKGYRFLKDKFGSAQLTPLLSDKVAPPRVKECSIHLEARVDSIQPFGGADSGVVAIDAQVVRTHVAPDLLLHGSDRHIDPDRWDPLIMKFTHFYGGARNVYPSTLAEAWRIPAPSRATNVADRWNWMETEYQGVQRTEVFSDAVITYWRMSAGSAFDVHSHDREEVLFIVEGELRFADSTVARSGDVVTAGPGDSHGATALVDSLFYVIEAQVTSDGYQIGCSSQATST